MVICYMGNLTGADPDLTAARFARFLSNENDALIRINNQIAYWIAAIPCGVQRALMLIFVSLVYLTLRLCEAFQVSQSSSTTTTTTTTTFHLFKVLLIAPDRTNNLSILPLPSTNQPFHFYKPIQAQQTFKTPPPDPRIVRKSKM
ncbi:uncharacterized protein CLUP02_00667 [Colletotrichum lupini]|uniref:Uncharacterized protein n=1 Tax=Colletotrichum lupini TaxID=145971 RepID=A0A9Q8SBJ7_9PEZI|nr:uncharacterized protein CLUP02_00667 [Colletotrichum lupini]UQC74020.1 hypothetical protein CLUP02_00667 [Colletotrichum lupini]